VLLFWIGPLLVVLSSLTDVVITERRIVVKTPLRHRGYAPTEIDTVSGTEISAPFWKRVVRGARLRIQFADGNTVVVQGGATNFRRLADYLRQTGKV